MPDETQIVMPLSRPERLALVDAIEPAAAGVTTRQWRSVRDLLKQIEFMPAGPIYLEVLAARMAVNRATVLRVAKLAEERGLLSRVATRQREGRQGANEWLIVWDRLRACRRRSAPEADVESSRQATATREVEETGPNPARHDAALEEIPESHGARPESHDGAPSAALRGAYKEESSSTLPEDLHGRQSTGAADRGRADQKKIWGTEEDWAECVRVAHEIEAAIGRIPDQRDWLLAIKAAAVSRRPGGLGEAWLASAVAGTKRRKADRTQKPLFKPWGYLNKVLDDGATKLQRVLRRELAMTRLPPELVRYDPARFAELRRPLNRDDFEAINDRRSKPIC